MTRLTLSSFQEIMGSPARLSGSEQGSLQRIIHISTRYPRYLLSILRFMPKNTSMDSRLYIVSRNLSSLTNKWKRPLTGIDRQRNGPDYGFSDAQTTERIRTKYTTQQTFLPIHMCHHVKFEFSRKEKLFQGIILKDLVIRVPIVMC